MSIAPEVLMPPTTNTAALAVRTARAAKGWTQQQLATAAGTTQAVVSRIERGEVDPRSNTLERLLAVLDGAQAMAPARAFVPVGSAGTLTDLDVGGMHTTEAPPVRWVVDSIAARGAVTMLAGKEGQGKSLLTQALAVGVASGKPVAGIGVDPGRALLIDAENGSGVIHRRLRTFGLSARVAERLMVKEAGHGFDLQRDLYQLYAAIERMEHRPDLLVLDSWKSLWSGSEHNTQSVVGCLTGLVELARKYDLAALLIHHTTKAGDTYRGSSAIGATLQAVFTFTRPAGDDPSLRALACKKMRLDAEPPTYYLAIEGGRLKRGEAPESE